MSTPNLPYSLLAFAIWQAFAASAHAQIPAQAMPEVVITGSKAGAASKAAIGGFSNAPLLQTPASISVLTREQMQELGIRNTSDAMKFDASVGDAYNAVGYAEQFSIRGFALDNSSSYRKDGLAIPGDTQIPLENKERIEVLKGLAGLQAGMAAPGGIVNYVTKRPTSAPLRSVTLGVSERGTLYGAADLGGRFEDKRFGYRLNAAAEKLRSYIKGADGKRQFASAAFDWQIAPQALLQLDFDYQHKSQLSAPGFQLFNGTDLPTGVAADMMLNNQPWARPVDTRSSNIGLRFEYQINPDWRTEIALNRHQFKRDDYTAFPYGGCTSALGDVGFCANGDYNVYDYRSLNESKSPLAAQALVHGKFATATVQHELTVGASGSRRRDRFGDYVYDAGDYSNFTSNIFKPVAVPAATSLTPGPASLRRRDDERAVFAQDIVRLSDSLALHGGLRYVSIKREERVKDINFDGHFVLPNAALVFNPASNLAVYGSFSEGLEHGGIAPIETMNEGSVLAPNKSKQYELGIKGELERNFSWSAAIFRITKPLEVFNLVNVNDPLPTFMHGGKAVHRGIELAANGRATPNLTIGLSMAGIQARQNETGDPSTNGKRVTNVPSFKASTYLDYAVPQVAGLKLNATWLHASSKAFTPDNSVTVPGYHVFNLGASYATRVAGTSTTLRANVDNALDKFYWRDVTQELGGYLFPGAPRTFRVSAQFDF